MGSKVMVSAAKKAAKVRYYEKNREACIARSRAQRQTAEYKVKQPVRSRKSLLKKRYGITPEDYDRMLAEQGGKCALCNTTSSHPWKYFSVDHNHTNGYVRALLCHACNTLVGYAEHSQLDAAIAYITKHAEHDPK